MQPCTTCQSIERKYTLKLIPSGKEYPMPKYIPQIKEVCADCNSYIKFAKQTPELVDALNELLLDLPL